MLQTGISLGWNCASASSGVDNGWRLKKSDGYKTCPFDMCITNYDGVVQCIRDDFKDFTNKEHLKLQTVPASILQSKETERLIYNTKYGFVFNHESPDHANLFDSEKWPMGRLHFVSNNWEAFCDRYDRRIRNFQEYVRSGRPILFILGSHVEDLSDLRNALATTYPGLNYTIRKIPINLSQYTTANEYMKYRV
jgi:hypothetical protein